jgi:hypothetical protein
VKVRYIQVKGSKEQSRDAGLRMLDRAARVLKSGEETDAVHEQTPHLATAIVDGKLHVAGNSGDRYVSAMDRVGGDKALSMAIKESLPRLLATKPSQCDAYTREQEKRRRERKNAMKLKALMSGDYRKAHPKADSALRAAAAALKIDAEWANVDKSRERVKFSAEHGEMTLLGKVHAELLSKPNPNPEQVIFADLGGVKKACATCHLAYEAYNEFIAPPGYQIRYSGTHEGFYTGWLAPQFIADNDKAMAHIRQGVPVASGGVFKLDNKNMVKLKPHKTRPGPNPNPEETSESESEWEEA